MKKITFLILMVSTLSFGKDPLVIAHRGGAGTAPENTLAAFGNAILVNADYYELDVMISSDDSLMIMHDATVNRTTDGTGTLASMTYNQLRELDAGSWFGPEYTGEKIPTLRESLVLAKNSPNDIGVVIEIKTGATSVPAKIVALVQLLEMESRVLVSSFSLAQITEVKGLDPSIAVQLFGTISQANIDQVVAINGDWVGSGGTLTQSIIDYAHLQGIYFNAWTLNSASTMLPAIALGVDGITTDVPQVMILLLDDTEPSDVVLTSAIPSETRINLVWDEAVDNESGIAGYDIFRDEAPDATTLLASIGKLTEYTDDTYTESHEYYYRIRAKNLAGLSSVNYSNEIAVSTLTDITPPVLTSITSRGDSSTVYIGFSERIDKATAETTGNYSLNYDAVVESARLARDLKSVILTTSPLSEQSYLLTVKNVSDRAATPNPMVKDIKIFLHQGLPESAVAFYKLDSIPFEDPDFLLIDETVNGNTGIVKNGAYTTEGILGNALGFDGVNDYVAFSASPSFDISGSGVTVSLWIKLPYAPYDLPVSYSPLFDSETDNYVLYGDRGNGELRFKVVTTGGAERPGIPSADVKAGEWIHVAGVYDGTNAMVYLNGVLKDSHPLTGTVKKGQVATLGKTGSTYFEGSIDQVEVYNRGMSEEEILAIYMGVNAAPISRNPGIVILETPLVDEVSLSLSWSESNNYESAIMGYEIYRDITENPTTLYATVGDTTSFVDNTSAENQTYYYRVKAKNTLGLLSQEYSNQVMSETGTDLTKPMVTYATSRGDAPGIILEFSEMLDPASAENTANYVIDQSVTVTGAMLALDQKSVILSTSALAEQSYLITLNGIKDLAALPNTILPDTRVIISHKAAPADLIAWYQMNNLPLEGADTLLIDATANANNGIVKNQPALIAGLLGNAVKFDPIQKQFVQFANSPSFDVSDTMVSISVWTKLTYLPIEMPVGYGPLFDSQGDEYVLYADRGNKELRFKVVTSANAERPGIPNDDLVTGQWINVFAVYDGSSARIYLNGLLKDVHPITGTVKPGIIPMLGKSGTAGTPSFFNGDIDNVQVFKNAFTDEEVMEMYEIYRMKAVFQCDSYDLTEEVSICGGESYIFPDGTLGAESMIHVSELTTVYGCDSIITTSLTVYQVDVALTQEMGVLTADASSGTYRWLDCDNNYTAISGETQQSFTPTTGGNYAVEVTMEGCADTSVCVYADPLGLDAWEKSGFKVYPNPSQGSFTLQMGASANQETRLEIVNSTGELLVNRILKGSAGNLIEIPEPIPGIYVIRISSQSGTYHKQIIIL